jgi:uncharacterized protein YdeI (YjbR/CyaY-like superfamily)
MAKRPARDVAARAAKELPTIAFPSPRAWETWLAKHHAGVRGAWVKFAKKGSGVKSVTYPEALDVALCYGWIDGQVRSLDERYYVQRFTPRRSRSNWSKINCGKAQRLIADGRMKPAGLAQVQAAKADGRWDTAYDSPRSAEAPDDLVAALRKNAAARAFFATLSARNRYAILHRIQDAKKPQTRARRIAQIVGMLKERKKPYP